MLCRRWCWTRSRLRSWSCLRGGASLASIAGTALVVEIVSPNDKTWDKLEFYAAHHVDELLIVDPERRTIHWFGRTEDEYSPLARSGLIELGADELAVRLDWPGHPAG